MRRRLAVVAGLALLLGGCAPLLEVEPVGEVRLLAPAQSSVVVDADGRVIADLHADQHRRLVDLDQIPQVMRDAVVAVEDARFYTHAGVDGRAIARAFLVNAREGEVVQGGSTITQQLAKNALTGGAETLRRKVEEASVALQLESQFSKEEILQRYLNTVYFGNGAYGVQTAARRYFGIDAQQLDLPQAALLAAMLKAPSHYDPFTRPEPAKARRDLVIHLMREQERISLEQASAAQASALGVVPPSSTAQWTAPYFVDHVLAQLQHDPVFAVLGDDATARAKRLFRGGLRIETTLDAGWQAAAERAVVDTLTHADDPDAAVVAIDPATGAIAALVGGRGYYDPDNEIARFNLATDALRQPGSTFKPILLATALDQGRRLDERYDAPPQIAITDAPGLATPWLVHNYTDVDFGELSLREATVFSVNSVYAQLMTDTGAAATAEMAAALGIRQELTPYLSLALGAQEVSVLEMASVQATLAAGGVYRAPTAVTRIVSSDGTVLYERPEPVGVRVLDQTVAWQVTTVLQEVIASGTGERAALGGRPVAGKTGTTQDGADAWFTGYTPDLAAAIWIGFHSGRVPMEPPTTRIRVEGGTWPAETFARFALRALEDTPASDFALPADQVTTVRVDTTRDCLPNAFTPPEVIAERAYLKGSAPTEICEEPTGPPTTDVPDVVGMPASAAQRQLTGAGFSVEIAEQFTVEVPPGYVVRQEPAPGRNRTLAGGYQATIYVSSADRTEVVVPDVLSLELDDARALLEDAGFAVEVTAACPGGSQVCTGATERPGAVWEQVPDAGAEIPVHSAIELSVYPSG